MRKRPFSPAQVGESLVTLLLRATLLPIPPFSPAKAGESLITLPLPSDIVADSTVPQQNMGGRPKGSSNANKQKNKLKWKQATNWVIVRYSEEKENAEAANDISTKQI
jgi:hypothetical protein